MPRPKLVSDTDVLDATRRVMRRQGPGFTLADVASEVGLSRAALIQRFENKAGLAKHLADHNRRELEALLAADPIGNKGPQRVLAFLERVLDTFEPSLLLADAEAVTSLHDAVVARLDEPSRQRAAEVADLLVTVLRGAAAEADRGHAAARLRLALKLVYAGAPTAG